ncbi:hypothetical protein [Actinomadura hibisca]|uniref:hypothetical protein n=1 Tax=Actinomadura hibisca TaxID=68565 RepID=UPI000830AD84|nr:hypothetical protein [Actinomadura hibisca]
MDELLAALQRASDLRGVLIWDETSALRVVVSFAGRGTSPAVSVTANFLDGRWWYAWAPDGGGPGPGSPTTITPVQDNAVQETLNVCRRTLWTLVASGGRP